MSYFEKNCNFENDEESYRNMAMLCGVDVQRMMMFARYHIDAAEDVVRLVERLHEILDLFKYVPQDLTEHDLVAAISQYDGDGSKPCCDLVYCGLDIIRRYLAKRREYCGRQNDPYQG